MAATDTDQTGDAATARAWRFALTATLLLTGLRLLALFATPLELYPDEAQYWLWSRTLEFGYFSKPPMIAWVIHLTTALGGDREPFVRLAAPLFHAVTGMMLFQVGRRLYGAWTGLAALLVYQLMGGVAVASIAITTDTPLLCFLSIALLAYVDLPTAKRPLFTAAGLGAALGLGMLSKYAAIYAVIGIALHLILSREARKVWTLKTAAVAIAVFALMIAPNVVWNALNGFETVQHTASNADLSSGLRFNIVELLGTIGDQFGLFGPAFALLIAAMVLGVRRRLLPPDLLLLCWTLPPLVVVGVQAFLTRANANWTAAAYVAGAVLAAAMITRWWPARRLNIPWMKVGAFAALGLQVVFAAVLLAFAANPRLADAAGLSNSIKRVRGWQDLTDRTLVRAQIEQADRGLSAIAVDDRFTFNAMAYYGRDYFAKPDSPPLTIWLRREHAGNQAEVQHPLTPELGQRVLVLTEDMIDYSADPDAKMAPRIALIRGDFALSESLDIIRSRLDKKRMRRGVLILGEGYQPKVKD